MILISKAKSSKIDEEFAAIAGEIEGGTYIRRRKPSKTGRDTWGGAKVIVTSKKVRPGYGAFVLKTPHAEAVGWYFNRIRHFAYGPGNLDYITKFPFYRDLANAVAELPKGADEQQVFEALFAATRAIFTLSMSER